MKQFTKAVALVAVTTLFATAFSTTAFRTTLITSHRDQPSPATNATASVQAVQQVVILGKRMTVAEKNQYDAELIAKLSVDARESRSDDLALAAK